MLAQRHPKDEAQAAVTLFGTNSGDRHPLVN